MTDTVDKIVIQAETQGVQQSTADVQGLTKAMDGVTVASQTVEKSTGSIDSKFASLERRFGTTAGQATQLAQAQKKINDFLAANPTETDRASEALAAVTARYGNATKATGELGHASEGLTGQQQALLHAARSATEGLLSGAPATQIVAQQFGHLSYASTGPGGLSEAFSGVSKTLGGLVTGIGAFITPTTVAIAGAAALGAAAAAAAVQFDRLQVASQRAISGAGQRTGTSVSDINAFTSQNSGLAGTSLSSKEARGLAEDFTKTGEIVISRLHGMSDAVVGFANQSGLSMADASKAMVGFAVDPEKALDELSKTFGSFDVSTRKAVDALVLADDKTGAFQVVIDALSEKSKNAAGNMGFFEKATRSVVNALASETVKPQGLEQQIESKRAQLNAAIDSSSDPFARDSGEASHNVETLSREFESLSQAMEKVKAQNASAEFNKLSTASDNAVKAILPQLTQLEQLKTKIEEINRAQAGGATSKYGASVDRSALAALQLQKQEVQESLDAETRRVAVVTELKAAYGGVSTQVAQTLSSLHDQLNVASQRTVQGQIQAQEEAQINALLMQGASYQEAASVASAQRAVSEEHVYQQMKKAVQSSQDQLDLVNATATGQEAQVRSAIAYRDAMQQGATETQAAAIAANTLAASMAQAAQAAAQSEQQQYNKANGYDSNGNMTAESLDAFHKATNASAFAPFEFAGYSASGEMGTNRNYNDLLRYQAMNEKLGVQGDVNSAYGNGDIAAAINAVKSASNTSGADPAIASLMGQKGYDFNAIFGQQASTINDKISQMDSLTQLQNAKTNDKGTQISNLQGEMDWLQTLPETISRDQKIVSLQQSIDSLKNATDANTAATSATLNPLYSQGHGALAIGYYKAANGLDGVAQGGIPGVDSVPIHIMAMPGEPIKVGAAAVNRGSNDNSRSTSIVNNFVFNNASTSNARRSQRQFAQGFGQIVAAGS